MDRFYHFDHLFVQIIVTNNSYKSRIHLFKGFEFLSKQMLIRSFKHYIRTYGGGETNFQKKRT